MIVTYERSHDETTDIRTFYFRPEKPFHYVAGQFIELTLVHDNPDDRGTKRWFTLSSSPTEELLSITTRLSAKGSSFKRMLQSLQPGDTLDMSEPMGDFVLPMDISRPLIFVAGGIGITPMHSMLTWLVDSHEARAIRLMYGVESETDIIFQDTFARADQHATIVVSKPSPAWGGERGRLNARLILGVEQPSPDSLIYLSGPEPMVESLSGQLQAAGVASSQIVTDSFPGYTHI